MRSRVLHIGLGPTAESALEALIERFEVVALVRAPEATRDGLPDPVIALANESGVPVHSDTGLIAVGALISKLKPDCVVISSYNRVVPGDWLTQSRFINVHYADLPKYRGRATVNWAILNAEPEIGISIHGVHSGLDSGDILFRKVIPIGDSETVTDLYRRLNEIQRGALADAIEKAVRGERGLPQDESAATYACGRNPEDGEIEWSGSTLGIYRLVRALTSPFPGAFTYFEGKRLLIHKAEPAPDSRTFVGRVPGRVIAVSRSAGYADVLTADGVLRIFEVQRDEEKPVAASELIRSTRDTLGLRKSDLIERIEMLEKELAMRQELQPIVAPRPSGKG
jgi:methionyl-tRNA formyltransferase